MLGSIEDPQVKICVPKEEVQKLKSKIEASDYENLPENLERQILKNNDDAKLTVNDLKWLKCNIDLELPIHELLTKWRIDVPEPPVIPRNRELEARIQRLRVEQEERDYRSMTKNVDSIRVKHPEDSIGYQIKMINRQLIAVLQFIFSVGAGFAFGFIGVQYMVGELDFGFRLLLGVICGLIIALAEIYFLAKQLAEDVFPPAASPMYKPHQE